MTTPDQRAEMMARVADVKLVADAQREEGSKLIADTIDMVTEQDIPALIADIKSLTRTIIDVSAIYYGEILYYRRQLDALVALQPSPLEWDSANEVWVAAK